MEGGANGRIGGGSGRGEKRHGPPLRRAGPYGKPRAGQHKRIRKTGRKSCRTFALPPICPTPCCCSPWRAAPPPQSIRRPRPPRHPPRRPPGPCPTARRTPNFSRHITKPNKPCPPQPKHNRG